MGHPAHKNHAAGVWFSRPVLVTWPAMVYAWLGLRLRTARIAATARTDMKHMKYTKHTTDAPRWLLVLAVTALLAVLGGGCSRANEASLSGESASRTRSIQQTSSAHGSSASLTSSEPFVDRDTSYRFPAPGRVVAIGDLHGDFAATRRAFRCAGAIDAKDRWIGGNLVVVQTGDLLDRGDGERSIIDFIEALKPQAEAAGGALHTLLGNHEIMNAQGDFRYVTPFGMTAFSTALPSSPTSPSVASATAGALPSSTTAYEQSVSSFPVEQRSRAAAFLPTGPYAKILSRFNTVIMVNDTVFVHGGLLPNHVRYGIRRINEDVQQWLVGKRPDLIALMRGDEAPIWSRKFSTDSTQERHCRTLETVLRQVGAKRMVVGHTPQKQGITSACGQQVWRVDVGLSAYYGGATVQVLAIDGSRVSVLRPGSGCADAP